MQIVIELPDEMWKLIKVGYVPLGISKCLMNGTPLPKHHGRLIDADALIFNADYYEPLISKRDFDFAPTIIEADKEAQECQPNS